MKMNLLISFLLLPLLGSQTENATIQQVQTNYSCNIIYYQRDNEILRVLFPVEVIVKNNKSNDMRLMRTSIKQKEDRNGWGPQVLSYESICDSLYSITDNPITEIAPLQTKRYVFYTFHEVYENKKFQKVFESYADSMRENKLKEMTLDYRKLTTKQLKILQNVLKGGDSLRIDYITFTDTANVRSRVKFPIQTDLILPVSYR